MSALPAIQERAAQSYAARAVTVRLDELGTVLPAMWPEVAGYVAQAGATIAGAPFIRYVKIDMEAGCDLEIGIPTLTPVDGMERIVGGVVPAGQYAVVIHEGPFDSLMESNAALQAWAAEQGLQFDVRGDVWTARIESYLTDPESSPDPASWQTELAYKLLDD